MKTERDGGGVSGVGGCQTPRAPQVDLGILVFIAGAIEILLVRGDKCIETNTRVEIEAHFEEVRAF